MIIFSVVLFFTLSPLAARGDISVVLRIDPHEATLAETVKLEVSIEGNRDSDDRPDIPGLDSFIVTPGGASSRVEYTNGRMRSAITHTYFIQPQKPGVFPIGPARIRIAKQAFQSNTETLKVLRPSAAAGTASATHFLRAELPDTDIFVEEQAGYILKLYTRTRVRDLSLQLPEIDGLTFTRLGNPSEERRVLNGISYNVLTIRYALVGDREGVYDVAPARMKMTVLDPGTRSRRNPFFNDPFFASVSGRPLTLFSNAARLNVRPLPVADRPADFSGLVGRFTIDSRLEPASVNVGESATLTVFVSGRGNVKRIPDLALEKTPGLKHYKDQPVLTARQEADGWQGSKTMKWALVPEESGDHVLPSFALSFFDPEARRYQTIRTPRRTLSVRTNASQKSRTVTAAIGNANTAVVKQDVIEVGRDILPIHTAMANLVPPARLYPGGWFFRFVLALPLLVYLLMLCILKLHKYSAENSDAVRAKRAARNFHRNCRKGRLRSSELIEAFRHYVNQRFALQYGALTPEDSAEILTVQGVSPDTCRRVERTIRQLEAAVYIGRGDDICESSGELAELIDRIEKEIR
ncbi:MAG: protein BatD [Desulfobacterales bacterium]|nr:protein BatD [Desulfobacterales bacterium]